MPANTSSARTKQHASDTPSPVSLNLDTLEREGDVPEPFVVVLGGERFVFRDIQDEDWQQVADIDENNPQEALRLLLGDDYEKFAAHKMKLWKLSRLLDEWRTHISGVGPGEGRGSFTS